MKKRNWFSTPQATVNFGLVLVVLIFNCVVVHRNTVDLQSAQDWITHTYQVFNQTNALLANLNDAEAAVREFVISADPKLLADFDSLTQAIPGKIHFLRQLVADNPDQLDRLTEGVGQVNLELDRLQSIVTAGKENDFAAARSQLVALGQNSGVRQVRQIFDKFQSQEADLLSLRQREQDYRLFIILAANLAAVAVNVAIMLAAWYLVERELARRRTAEADARSERQNLWVTLTSIADGVIVTDEQGRVKLANPIALELLRNPADVIGQPFAKLFRIIDEIRRAPILDPVRDVMERGNLAGDVDQAILVRPDGSEVPIDRSAAPIRDHKGQMTGVVFVFHDSTARRRIEREMSERERRFRRVFESPLIGIGIGTANGNLLDANDVYLDLIGYRRGQVDITALSWDGKPKGVSPLDDSTRQELDDSGTCKPFERTYTRTDGQRVPVLISAARLMDEQNRIVIFVTDLSQSKRAEAALRESEARFRVLSECMPQKVWTAAADGQLEYLNNMFLEYTRLPPDGLKGWSWTSSIFPGDLELHLDAWNNSLSSGDMFEIEHRLRKHTGEYRWHLCRALPIYKPDGTIAMWIGTDTDIHDQKQAEETLREEHRRKDQFLALLAHELRNPLAPLSNAIQVFPAVQNDPDNSAALLGIMQRQVGQMTRLIDDLLDLARITTGRMRLQRERIAVAAVVSAAVEAIEPFRLEREHHLTVRTPDEELWLDADATRLAQVLTNLLHNAAKYTDTGGQISLTVERVDSDVLFKVRDNGSGISKEMLTRIFDLFMQVELTLDRSHGGLGIGLTLVRTLVELHGGRVTASSEGVGQGSEFVVRLPLLVGCSPVQPKVTITPHQQVASLPPLRIMVVDDVQASAKTLALMLQSLGQSATVAFDGATAIRYATQAPFDLIFLDIAMPGMDGLEVARRLRATPELDSVVLVALTGFGQQEDRVQSLQAGFNDHITKPTSLDLLKGILRQTAASKTLPSDRFSPADQIT